MNTDRLHSIAIAIRDEIAGLGLSTKLDQLVDTLQNQINQPSQPQFQQQFSQIYSDMIQSLKNTPSNKFRPIWIQTIQELGFNEYVGNNLKEKIEDIFSRNQITPTIALNELSVIRAKVAEIKISVDQICAAFANFNINTEQLNPGECEIGVLIPRKFVDNKLRQLGEEVEELDRIFGVFGEIITGSRSGFEIRTVSTTDFSILIKVLPKVGAIVAKATEKIILVYKGLLEIRLLKKKLSEQGVDDQDLTGVEHHANTLMEKRITQFVDELMDEFYNSPDGGRKNELKIELGITLTKIANRVDRGFNLEVRMGALAEAKPEDPGSEEALKQAELIKHHTQIESASAQMQYLKLEGDPLLSLPESPKQV